MGVEEKKTKKYSVGTNRNSQTAMLLEEETEGRRNESTPPSDTMSRDQDSIDGIFEPGVTQPSVGVFSLCCRPKSSRRLELRTLPPLKEPEDECCVIL